VLAGGALPVGQHDLVDDEVERAILGVRAVVVVGLQAPGHGQLLTLADVGADDALGQAVEGHAVDEHRLALGAVGAAAAIVSETELGECLAAIAGAGLGVGDGAAGQDGAVHRVPPVVGVAVDEAPLSTALPCHAGAQAQAAAPPPVGHD
jgi:hypothetical protein